MSTPGAPRSTQEHPSNIQEHLKSTPGASSGTLKHSAAPGSLQEHPGAGKAHNNQHGVHQPQVEFRSPLAQTLKGLTSGGCPAWAGMGGSNKNMSHAQGGMRRNMTFNFFSNDSPPPSLKIKGGGFMDSQHARAQDTLNPKP